MSLSDNNNQPPAPTPTPTAEQPPKVAPVAQAQNTPSGVNPSAPSASNKADGALSMPKFSLNLEDIRDYLIVILGFGISIVLVFLLIIPQFEKISVINAKFVQVDSKLQEVTRQSDYLEGLVGLKDELQSKIDIADQVLPSTEDRVPYTLDQLVQIAEESNVSVDSLSLSGISDPDKATEGDVRTVLIQLSVVGSLNNVQDFFYKLENARTIVDISTFQLSHETINSEIQGDSDEDTILVETRQVKVNFALRSYLKPEVGNQSVDLTALARTPNYDALFEKLRGMDFYDTNPLEVEFGRENPFDITESTPSVDLNDNFDSVEEIPVVEEEDASGIE